MSEQQAAIEAVSDFTARQTYRHIRIGMVVAAFALGVSVLYEHFTSADRWSKLCWQGSISAYYWTPAHSVFVGALTAIGLSMIVLTTYGPYENMFLNLAGTMALLVALIPPARPGRCAASRPVDLSVGFDVANNVFAFFLGAAAALATTLALVSVVHKTPPMAGQAQRKAWQVQVVVQAGVLFGLAIWHFVVKHGFQSFAHPASAVLMFVFIFIVVVINAHKATVSDSFRTLYALVQWFMVGSVALLLGVKGIVSLGSRSWDHYILLIEIAMIISFVAFWSLQTAELWKAKAGLPAGGPDLV